MGAEVLFVAAKNKDMPTFLARIVVGFVTGIVALAVGAITIEGEPE
jgi:hypothetical protein